MRFDLGRFGLVGLASFVALIAGCPESRERCVPGASVECVCSGGGRGAQVCTADGTYGVCDCGPGVDAGMDSGLDSGLDSGPPDGPDAALDAPIARDARPPRDAQRPDGSLPCGEALDLLLVVDTSNSMTEEQALLAAEIPRLVQILASGDRDGDGTADFTPFTSVQVGVTTPDLGTGPYDVPTCNSMGEDGRLVTRARTSMPGCDPTYPAVHELSAGESTVDFAADVACVAGGTGGCGFEQQLEATLKALSPDEATSWTADPYTPPTFYGGTSGHALGANAGFVRDGSVLAVVVLTDEEDCSLPDPALFDLSSVPFGGVDLNLRCHTFPEELHPVSRFVDGIAALRPDPSQLVVSIIAGVPVDLSGDSAAEYDAILADPRMEERVDPSMPNRLVPVCNTIGRGIAFPARRLVEFARGLDERGAHTSVAAICNDDFSPAIDQLIGSIADAAASCE